MVETVGKIEFESTTTTPKLIEPLYIVDKGEVLRSMGYGAEDGSKSTRTDEDRMEVSIDPTVFRDSQGKFRTTSLFGELNKEKKYPSFFTLKDEDQDDLISMKRVYLEIADLTEYKVSQKLLGSWKHWQHLCSVPWFTKIVAEWRVELKAKLKSDALSNLRDFSKKKDGLGFAANKILYDIDKEPKAQPKRGRPTKAEITKEAKDYVENTIVTEDDAKRIGLL